MLVAAATVPASLQAQTSPQSRLFGVNWAGAEFGGSRWPGTINQDYIYPADPARGVYFHGKGLTLVRVPFDWERLQNQANGPLSTQDVAGLRSVLNAAQQSGDLVILDMHDFGRYYGQPLDPTFSRDMFADAWRKIATEYRSHPALYGYELMNEPHDLAGGGDGWAQLAQAATDAIRQVDTQHTILIPGYSWQSARFWPENNPNLAISDPSNNIVYAAHLYFDSDYSGGYNRSYDADGAYPLIGSDRVQPFLTWLQQHNARGMLTEYGIPDDDYRWNVVLNNFLGTISTSPYIVGGTYWAAGPWWGTYRLSVEPQNGVDRPQMPILQNYPSYTTPPQPTSTPTATLVPPTFTATATVTATPVPPTFTPTLVLPTATATARATNTPRPTATPRCEVNVRIDGVTRGWKPC